MVFVQHVIVQLWILQMSKFTHACPEWDFAIIDETMHEFEVCRCFGKLIRVKI
jgi:hypothetical protein